VVYKDVDPNAADLKGFAYDARGKLIARFPAGNGPHPVATR
jgi:hypothetical protein